MRSLGGSGTTIGTQAATMHALKTASDSVFIDKPNAFGLQKLPTRGAAQRKLCSGAHDRSQA
jgi:hypothetical protein